MSAAKDGTSECCGPAPREVDISCKVAFLASPRVYAERPARVAIVETHFSWVFLTDRYVYKLKKPLRGDGFDFSTAPARRRNAEAEVRLNRRLAPDVYVGVVPLTLAGGGSSLAIGAKGVVVDWLVKMVRLSAERMLDRRLARGDWHYADIHALAACLGKFFATARRVPIQPIAYLDRFHAECRASRSAFRCSGSPALQHAVNCVVRCIEAFIGRHNDVLLQRLEDRRVVEGHGDLRPEHICLGSMPRIIDCLEFRLDLRCLDPVDELAFLTMECERLGAPSIGRMLFQHYCRRTGDCPPPVLIAFYKAIGALIRARIAILHLQEIPVRDPAKWPKRAAEYLEIARRECRHLDL
jgi:aminoglycoside phosphotransferase family enzyme